MNKMRLFSLIVGTFFSAYATAQDRPIGYWRAHMPYTELRGAATDGVRFFVATKESFFTYDVAQDEISAYSKVEGMADVEMSAVAYDATTDITVLGYKNANIDLFIDETFYNIPDIKIKVMNELKQINQIYTENGMAFLSTSFGVVVLDLTRKETKETYSFTTNNQTIPVRSFTSDAVYYYAATTSGLYRASKNNPNLQAFSSWQKIDGHTELINLLHYNNTIYAHDTDSLYQWNGTTMDLLFASQYQITSISPAENALYVGEYLPNAYVGRVRKLGFDGVVTDSFNTRSNPLGILRLSSGSDLYEVDGFNGLTRISNGAWQAEIKPSGPSGYGAFDIIANNNELWVAHGGYNREWTYTFNLDGFSRFSNGKWQAFNFRNTPELTDRNSDFVRVAQDPVDKNVYLGSYRAGIYRYAPDGKFEELTQTSPVFEGTVGDPNAYRISGLAFDNDNNLWINQYGAPHELVVKTKDGKYYNFAGAGARTAGASVIIDDYNQKWYITPGNGVAVYNDNYTIDNVSDDTYGRINSAKKLPSDNTLCIVKDKEGAIWVGTSDGIGIINCPGEAIQGTCNVEKRIVQYDNFAGFLFQGESVMSIAVDGANRKWIGTANGVWLVSPSADKIIYRFTAENSPLPSNSIQKIAIDPVTGDVYFGTDLGIVSYRSTATEGTETATNVTTFPNPVPSGYNGTVAIKGLPANADVRITDITGQLIYRTKALGGQAVWTGKDYTGRTPQSGVYLIFATNTDGTQTYKGKMVFME
jgi:hypothetical protein